MPQGIIESLEGRRLLSATLTEGVLTVGGTAGNDVITVTAANTSLTVKVGAATNTFAIAKVNKIVVNAGAGNDAVSIGSTVAKPTILNGQDGNDSLLGGPGNDTLNGGGGNDTLRGYTGRDILIGGTGVDTADYSTKEVAVKVDLDGVADDGVANEADNVMPDVENVAGGAGNDTLVGNAAANRLTGNGGDDVLVGSGGNDDLDGNAGDDTLDGGTGTNALNGGAGSDAFLHSGGTDAVEDKQEQDTEETPTPPQAAVVFGTVVGTTVTLNSEGHFAGGTLTIAVPTDGGAIANRTFKITTATVVKVDGTTTPLGSLPAGLRVRVATVAGTTTTPPTAASVTAEGAYTEGTVSAVGTNTITLKGKDGAADRKFTVAAGAVVTLNGLPATLAQVPVGAAVRLKLSATDDTVAVAVAAKVAVPPPVTSAEGVIVAVSTQPKTITLKGVEGKPDATFAVSDTATVTVGGVATPFASLPAGLKVKLTLNGATPPIVTAIVAGPGPVVEGKVAAVGATTDPRTITLQVEGATTGKTYVVAANATVTLNGAAAALGAIPVGAAVRLQLSALDGQTVVGITATFQVPPPITSAEGVIVSVGATSDPLTITLKGVEGQPDRTFAVSATATITVDGNPVLLGSLPAGLKVKLTLNGATPPVVTAIVAAPGPVVEGKVAAVNASADPRTITVKGVDGQPDRVFVVPATATVTLNGAAVALGAVPVGAGVRIQLSALSATTAVTVAATTAVVDPPPPTVTKVEGAVVAVTTDPRSITLKGVEGQADRTFAVSDTATITVDGVTTALGSLPAGLRVTLTVTGTGTSAVVTSIVAVGPKVTGKVASANVAARTVTLQGPEGTTGTTYTVAANAVIRVGDAVGSFASLTAGRTVTLQLSALNTTLVTAIQVAV
jgi:hypothetical protein